MFLKYESLVKSTGTNPNFNDITFAFNHYQITIPFSCH